MFCRNCGRETADDAAFCPSCGVPAGVGFGHCPHCGAATDQTMNACPRCGGPLLAGGQQNAPRSAAEGQQPGGGWQPNCGNPYNPPPPGHGAQQGYSYPNPNPNQGYGPGYAPPQGYAPTGGAPYAGPYMEQKSRLVAGLLGIFIGSLGIHNFYLGYKQRAIIQLVVSLVGGFFTCGVATAGIAVWALVEAIMIFTGSIAVDGYGIPLKD